MDARSSDGIGGGPDTLPRYNVSLDRGPLMLHMATRNADLPISPGASHPKEAAAKRKLRLMRG